MSSLDPRTLILEAVEAHGGLERWNGLEAIEAEVSAAGLVFVARWRLPLRRVWLRLATRQPAVEAYDYPQPGRRGELRANKEVRVLDGQGNVVTSRPEPRRAFSHPRRMIYWDDLDLLYVVSYTFWNTLLAPFHLLREDIRVTALEPADVPAGRLDRLQVTFPPYVPTHATHQIYGFDAERRLRRVEYTAEPVGKWVRVAQLAEEFRTYAGLLLATRHRIVPHMANEEPWARPELARLEIHQARGVVQ